MEQIIDKIVADTIEAIYKSQGIEVKRNGDSIMMLPATHIKAVIELQQAIDRLALRAAFDR